VKIHRELLIKILRLCLLSYTRVELMRISSVREFNLFFLIEKTEEGIIYTRQTRKSSNFVVYLRYFFAVFFRIFDFFFTTVFFFLGTVFFPPLFDL